MYVKLPPEATLPSSNKQFQAMYIYYPLFVSWARFRLYWWENCWECRSDAARRGEKLIWAWGPVDSWKSVSSSSCSLCDSPSLYGINYYYCIGWSEDWGGMSTAMMQNIDKSGGGRYYFAVSKKGSQWFALLIVGIRSGWDVKVLVKKMVVMEVVETSHTSEEFCTKFHIESE